MKELYDKVAADPALQKEVMKILAGAEEKDARAVETELLAFAEAQGFKVTMEEVKAFFAEMTAADELSEGELDMVAGGKVRAEGLLHSLSTGIQCAITSLSKYIDDGKDACHDFYFTD